MYSHNKLKSHRLRFHAESPFKKVKRSIRSFLLGLFIASVYGMMALFVQNHGLWYSLISTVVFAAIVAYGMGLSEAIRANVMLMLPTLCSSKFTTRRLVVKLLLAGISNYSMNYQTNRPSIFKLFSHHQENGKAILLFLAFSMVVQGPMNNTMENFDRAAASVVCGAELAMNQTQELMGRAATPLLRECIGNHAVYTAL